MLPTIMPLNALICGLEKPNLICEEFDFALPLTVATRPIWTSVHLPEMGNQSQTGF